MKLNHITPMLAILAGAIVLIWPDIVAYALGIFLILYGAIELAKRN